MKVGFLALWLLDSGQGDLRRPGDWTKCCANPFARISPTRNLHFRKKKACIRFEQEIPMRVFHREPADDQDTKTEVYQSHDAFRVSTGPEREVLSSIQCLKPSTQRPLQDWRASPHYKVLSNGYTLLLS